MIFAFAIASYRKARSDFNQVICKGASALDFVSENCAACRKLTEQNVISPRSARRTRSRKRFGHFSFLRDLRAFVVSQIDSELCVYPPLRLHSGHALGDSELLAA